MRWERVPPRIRKKEKEQTDLKVDHTLKLKLVTSVSAGRFTARVGRLCFVTTAGGLVADVYTLDEIFVLSSAILDLRASCILYSFLLSALSGLSSGSGSSISCCLSNKESNQTPRPSSVTAISWRMTGTGEAQVLVRDDRSCSDTARPTWPLSVFSWDAVMLLLPPEVGCALQTNAGEHFRQAFSSVSDRLQTLKFPLGLKQQPHRSTRSSSSSSPLLDRQHHHHQFSPVYILIMYLYFRMMGYGLQRQPVSWRRPQLLSVYQVDS